MIDLHLHLLPGVDDGPPDLPAALALARECCASGTPLVVATPHYDDWTRAALPDAAALHVHMARLEEELRRQDIPLRVLPGAEAFLTPDLPRRVRDGLVPTLAGTSWLLVETPLQHKPPYLEQVFFELLAMGITPLLAHPERYAWLSAHPETLGALVERGARAQVTASSLSGRRGRRQRALAETFVRGGVAQIIASDRHGAGGADSLQEGYDAAVALVGAERALYLVETNPRLVVEGQALPLALDAAPPGGRWRDRWLRR